MFFLWEKRVKLGVSNHWNLQYNTWFFHILLGQAKMSSQKLFFFYHSKGLSSGLFKYWYTCQTWHKKTVWTKERKRTQKMHFLLVLTFNVLLRFVLCKIKLFYFQCRAFIQALESRVLNIVFSFRPRYQRGWLTQKHYKTLCCRSSSCFSSLF